MDRSAGSTVAGGVSPREPRLRLVSATENAAAAGPNSVRAKPVGFDRDASLDDALAAILSACLDQFTANLPAFRATGHPESVHQMRVALRRLRAAIGLTKRARPCPELETASARAKAL